MTDYVFLTNLIVGVLTFDGQNDCGAPIHVIMSCTSKGAQPLSQCTHLWHVCTHVRSM